MLSHLNIAGHTCILLFQFDNAMAAKREMIGVSGMECPVCYETFKDGSMAVLVECGGNHLVCNECVDEVMVRDEEPACPMCWKTCASTTTVSLKFPLQDPLQAVATVATTTLP